MEIKIDAKCPRCGASIQFHHVSDVKDNPCKLEFLDKTFEIGKSSSMAAVQRNMKPSRSETAPSAQQGVTEYFNNMFKIVGQTQGKKELLELKKQLMKTNLKVNRNIEKEFKEGKEEVLKEINSRLKSKPKRGLAYRGIFDGKKPNA